MSQCIVITGASSGIGRAVATRLARPDAGLVIVGRDETRLQDTHRRVTQAGAQCTWVAADLCDADGPGKVVDAAVSTFGAITGLVLAAGVYTPAPLTQTSDAVFERTWRTNVYAPYALIRTAHAHMPRDGSAAIVMVSSVSGRRPFANESAYAASKGAIDALVGSLAVELAADGIRVNGVAPGFTETEMNTTVRENRAIVDSALAATLTHRLGRPDDIAAAVDYLLSPGAEYVCGVMLPVDGGYPTSAIQAGLI
ncbi:SDR family NAD(P)-dependent oxidoreductase [Mycobacterium aquaticum]|uniref:Ketoreductase domain-containing protein n=1 Tax=Mycobacterium aquaticum TaxID=1927124 RepID=A0A1X0BAM7_9MYCO|nr:SDR family oxidoreductase [Mycobacterium aquaticum]ORA39411.1 hypothetical protein BST13_02945 [Mycobacterium aquaticum]